GARRGDPARQRAEFRERGAGRGQVRKTGCLRAQAEPGGAIARCGARDGEAARRGAPRAADGGQEEKMKRIATGLLALGMSLAAVAQTPAKPIRMIVPWPAGGTVDGVARVIGPSFSSGLGRTLIVENKAGAGGSIGQAEAAKAPADGNTVLLVFDTHAVNHLLYKNLGYDPFKSFEHVSLLVTSPQVLVGATNFAPNTVQELVTLAKANPGKVTYATVGAGSSNHLNALLLSNRTGIEMTHVPYKGGAPMMIDLVGGQVNVMFVSAPQAIPQVKAGRIKALAIGAAHRISQLPDTPTVAETLPGFAAQSWVGMLVPAGTPKEI